MAAGKGLAVYVELVAVPDAIDRLLPLLEQHAANALTKEPGCLQFDISRDGTNPDLIRLYEVYADKAAYDTHLVSEHMDWYRQQSKGLTRDVRVTVNERLAAPAKPPTARPKALVAVVHLVGRLHLLRPLEEAGFELVVSPKNAPLTEADLLELLPGCVATLAGSEPYNEKVFAAAKDLKVIARLGVGYDAVDVQAATRAGVAVAMAFGTNHEAVADHAFAMMASLAHALRRYDQDVRDGKWRLLFHGKLTGATVGVVGFGRIGRALAKRCQGFGMDVLVCDPIMDVETVGRLGCHLVSLEELLRSSDFVSMHTPVTPETTRMMNADALAQMKPSAFLINTSRGAVVDEPALIEALEKGTIAGAALDVTAVEPLPADSKLRSLQNVLLSPHSAGASEWAIESMAARVIANVLEVCAGQDPGAGLVLNPEVFAGRGT